MGVTKTMLPMIGGIAGAIRGGAGGKAGILGGALGGLLDVWQKHHAGKGGGFEKGPMGLPGGVGGPFGQMAQQQLGPVRNLVGKLGGAEKLGRFDEVLNQKLPGLAGGNTGIVKPPALGAPRELAGEEDLAPPRSLSDPASLASPPDLSAPRTLGRPRSFSRPRRFGR